LEPSSFTSRPGDPNERPLKGAAAAEDPMAATQKKESALDDPEQSSTQDKDVQPRRADAAEEVLLPRAAGADRDRRDEPEQTKS